MTSKRLNECVLTIVLPATAILVSGCARPSEEAKTNETPPRISSTVEPSTRVLAMASPTPIATPATRRPLPTNPMEIRAAVARVFDTVAGSDAAQPLFAIGDFNGDGSEDLAVVVKPSEHSLAEMNNEFANWTLEDPRNLAIPKAGSNARSPLPKPVRVEKGDTLLAIIHGVGPTGWRAPEAKQTFVLKSEAGLKILVQPAKALKDAGQKFSPVRGDVIKETIGSKSGFIFWTGAKYGWFPSAAE